MRNKLIGRVTSPLIPFFTLFEVAFFWHHLWLTFILLMLTSAWAIYFSDNKVLVFYLWLSASVGGPIAETFAIHFGAWHYALPNHHATIPIWLAPCWGLAGVFFYNVSKRLERILKQK